VYPLFIKPSSPDDAKLEELILFVASRSEDDPHFGSTKLNKLLFFADFLAYVTLGKAITNQEYMRLPNGPAPRRMKPIITQMCAAHSLALAERDRYGKTQEVPKALRGADLKLFSAEEIAVVTDVLDGFRKKNARGISSLSHKFAGWKLAKDRETIPYAVALVEFKKPRKRDIEKAMAMRGELASLRRESRRPDADE
jgi:hypothetical protein